MIAQNALESPIFYLQHAKYFNALWHKQMDVILADTQPSETHRRLMHAQARLYLSQKRDCQLTALHMVYDEAMRCGQDYENCGMVLEIDLNEKGISGDGVYYGLYPVGDFGLACHIHKEDLLVGLTDKECQFFGLV